MHTPSSRAVVLLQTLYSILQNDNEIRKARSKAREGAGDMLVPLGERRGQPTGVYRTSSQNNAKHSLAI